MMRSRSPIKWTMSMSRQKLIKLQGECITLDAMIVEIPLSVEKFREVTSAARGMNGNQVTNILARGRPPALRCVFVILQGLGRSLYFAASLGCGYVHGGLPHNTLWEYIQHMLRCGVTVYVFDPKYNYWDVAGAVSHPVMVINDFDTFVSEVSRKHGLEKAEEVQQLFNAVGKDHFEQLRTVVIEENQSSSRNDDFRGGFMKVDLGINGGENRARQANFSGLAVSTLRSNHQRIARDFLQPQIHFSNLIKALLPD